MKSQTTIDAAQRESRPKLLFVYGKTCGHSRRIEGYLAQVLQRRQNHKTFDLVRVCAETHPKLVEQLGVSEVPAMLVIDQRRIEARVERPHGRQEIVSALVSGSGSACLDAGPGWHRTAVASQKADVLLAHARNLISASWTQHAEARDADGIAINPWEPDAASWSLLGALVSGYERFVWADGQRVALEQLARVCMLLADVLDSDSLADWNDAPGRTQAEVLAALDEAGRRRALSAGGHSV